MYHHGRASGGPMYHHGRASGGPMYHHGRASGDDQCTIMEGRVEMTNVPSWKGEWR